MLRNGARYARLLCNVTNKPQLITWKMGRFYTTDDKVPSPPLIVDAKTNMDPNAEVSVLSGIPDDQKERLVRIFVPARNAMQQGTDKASNWKVEFARQYSTGNSWADPLMGWQASNDPLRGKLRALSFESLQDAINYCHRNGLTFTVEEPPKQVIKGKSYAKKFKYRGPKKTANAEEE
jgi:NADH dehydrogenase (ubiquinone) Fe-S protein 4